jgi:hypothetical protein
MLPYPHRVHPRRLLTFGQRPLAPPRCLQLRAKRWIPRLSGREFPTNRLELGSEGFLFSPAASNSAPTATSCAFSVSFSSRNATNASSSDWHLRALISARAAANRLRVYLPIILRRLPRAAALGRPRKIPIQVQGIRRRRYWQLTSAVAPSLQLYRDIPLSKLV